MTSFNKLIILSLIASLLLVDAFAPQSSPSEYHPLKFTDTALLPGSSPVFIRNKVLLHAKKKDPTAPKGGKIQVKLTKHVPGTGIAGDIIKVAPAFFLNKLQKTGSAVRISDEEVEKEKAEKQQQKDEAKALAMDMKAKLEAMEITMAKTAGEDGKLFGGIGYKAIMDELKKEFPKGCLDAKYIKITQIKNANGEVEKHDIKSTGDYVATISLLKDVSSEFKLSVVAE